MKLSYLLSWSANANYISSEMSTELKELSELDDYVENE